jgi:hypothetical protein
MTDAVGKVRGILLTRNNQIIGVNFLHRTYALDAYFESILLRDPPPKTLFSTASTPSTRLWTGSARDTRPLRTWP